MKQQSFAIALFTSLAASALLFSDGAMAAKSGGTAAGGNWGSGTAISPVNQPDPTRGAQSNDIAVNASGLAVAAWDQYTCNYAGGATIGVAITQFVPVAVDAKGNVTAAWTTWDGSHSVIQAATCPTWRNTRFAAARRDRGRYRSTSRKRLFRTVAATSRVRSSRSTRMASRR
jgi:hypothetical protein